ncbi:MAG: CPBP family intramembrane metalloprotease [Rhodobacterales bacterium]|nr:MAG: CPBP family intramembrane metalloprotease [Rhodobacterales bacterium]
MSYAAHETLVAPARAASEPWRLAFGVVLLVALYLAFGFAYFNLLAELVTQTEWPQLAHEIDHGSTPRGMLALLASFALLIAALALVLHNLHQRQLATLMGPFRRTLAAFTRVTVALLALGILLWLLPQPGAMATTTNLPAMRWLALLPLALLLILVQITAEELIFRGYLQSQLAALSPHPALWLFLPSALFALLHFDPQTAGENAPLYVLTAFLFGLAAADLTARAGNLGPALALHLAFNVSALLITAPADHNFGLALWQLPFGMDDTTARAIWVPYDMLTLLCSWLAARLALT